MEGTTRSLAWWLLVTCAFCFTRVANAQISSGPLARPHEGLSGAANCIKCHEVSTKAPSFRGNARGLPLTRGRERLRGTK